MENSEEKIVEVLAKYKPSKYELFMYGLFGNKTFKIVFPGYLFLSFLLGFIFMQSNMKSVTLILLITSFIVLGLFAITSLIAVQMNNSKIKKIAKELNVSLDEVTYLRTNYK